MKKFALLALLLSLGVFTIGCDKAKKAEPAKGADGAAAPADGAAAPADGAAPADTK
jgi:hypothetical protein